ncbi:type VII secretion target [Nocardia coffeae]|uniref:type VII secretion target n=1 Tax=Nocardia coffeae TaxID=2873381 RepID=UPI003556A6B6
MHQRCLRRWGDVIMAGELHVELERLRELATTFDRAVRGIDGLTTNANTPEVVAALGKSATGDACHAGAQVAQAALAKVTGHYRTLHAGTHTSADTYETCDSDFGRRIEALRKSL